MPTCAQRCGKSARAHWTAGWHRGAFQAVAIITELEEVIKPLRGSRRVAVRAERNSLENNRERLDYRGFQERGEPAGSGAMESTCKQNNINAAFTVPGDSGRKRAMRL